MRQCWIAIACAALTLSGCSSRPLLDVSVRVGSGIHGLRYRPLAANAVRTWVNVSNAPVEIADLKISVAPQPENWATCARAWTNGRRNTIRCSSGSCRNRHAPRIMIDRCDRDSTSTLGTNF